MAKTMEWTVNVNGKDHRVVFVPNQMSFTKHELKVDGRKVELNFKSMKGKAGLDQKFKIAGKEAHFVLIGSRADVAVDGIYVGSGKAYTPIEKFPQWSILFVLAPLLIPFIRLGGTVTIFAPIALALIGMILNIRFASSALQTKYKVLICILITALLWSAHAALAYFIQ